MSMRAVEFMGYGIDLAWLLESEPGAIEMYREMVWGGDVFPLEYQYEPGESFTCNLVSPSNTDAFELLIYIPTIYPVRSAEAPEPTIYDRSEANAVVAKDAVRILEILKTEPGADEALMDALIAKTPALVEQLACYDYEADSAWSDVI